jgi:hypothetical protein
MQASIFGLVVPLAFGLSTAGLAQDLKAEQRFEGTTVAFNVPANLGTLMLTVSGPFDFYATATARSTSPIIDLSRSGKAEDGAYAYQLTASTDERVRSRSELDNGRDSAQTALKSIATSGTFNVRGGVIVPVKPRPPLTSDRKSRQDQQ